MGGTAKQPPFSSAVLATATNAAAKLLCMYVSDDGFSRQGKSGKSAGVVAVMEDPQGWDKGLKGLLGLLRWVKGDLDVDRARLKVEWNVKEFEGGGF